MIVTKRMLRTPPRPPSPARCDSQVVMFHHETPAPLSKLSRIHPEKRSPSEEPELFASPVLSPVAVQETSPLPDVPNVTFVPFRAAPFRAAAFQQYLNTKRTATDRFFKGN